MSTTPPIAEAAQRTNRPVLLPPEEKFWKRYSPHHEAPISGVTSMLLHLLVILLLLGIVWLQSVLKLDEENRPPPVDVVSLTPGGDNQPVGPGDGPGGEKDGVKKEDELPRRDKKDLPPDHEKLTGPQKSPPPDDFGKVPSRIKDSTTLGELDRIGREATERLREIQRGLGGKDGRGPDKGSDRGTKRPPSTPDPKMVRNDRWSINFTTVSGKDYLNQLAGLGAILGVPVKGQDRQYLLIRDLHKPGNARVEDVSRLHRIFWFDDKPESVRSLFSVLPQPRPDYFVAFFPDSLEQRMLQLELDYLERRSLPRDESLVKRTLFDVFRSRDGYDVRLQSVELKPR
jgi:hypothetical protein